MKAVYRASEAINTCENPHVFILFYLIMSYDNVKLGHSNYWQTKNIYKHGWASFS